MPKLMKKRSKKADLPPGTLIHIGERKTEEIKIEGVNNHRYDIYAPHVYCWSLWDEF